MKLDYGMFKTETCRKLVTGKHSFGIRIFYSEWSETRCLIVISGFRREVAENSALLGFYAVNSKEASSGLFF